MKEAEGEVKELPVCATHNLLCDSVCLAETCRDRLKCQICVKKHQHKFYLDDKERDKKLEVIKDEIQTKLDFVQTYKKSNILNLRLVEYKQQLEKKFDDQLMFLQSKVLEQTLNFNLNMQKIQHKIQTLLTSTRESILQQWQSYYSDSMTHFNCDQQILQLKSHFQSLHPTEPPQIQKCVKFLYSDELVFRFNKQFDSLKARIQHVKKQNQIATDWFEAKQFRAAKVGLCVREQFLDWGDLYEDQPKRMGFEEERTRETRGEEGVVWEGMRKGDGEEEEQREMLQIKIKYENFQHIFRICRFDNQKFVSSGGRSVNTWNRISLAPDRVYPLEYPSYGLLRFKQQNSSARILFGLSNGQLCQINPSNDQINRVAAHQNTIRQLIQYDSNHLISASQDWTMKVWAITQNPSQPNFITYRDTLKGHCGKVYTATKFGPNILSGGIDGTIKLWDIIRSEFDEVFPQQKQIYALREMRQQLFVSAGEVKELRFWDYRKTKAPVIRYQLEGNANCLLRFDENRMGFNDRNVVRVVDVRAMKEPVEVFRDEKIYSFTVNHMEFLSDNEVGIGGSDNFITVWKY